MPFSIRRAFFNRKAALTYYFHLLSSNRRHEAMRKMRGLLPGRLTFVVKLIAHRMYSYFRDYIAGDFIASLHN